MPVKKKKATTRKTATRKTTTAKTTARKTAKKATTRKTTAKKAAAPKAAKRKVSAKKAATKKKTTARKASPTTAIRSAFNKSQMMTEIADATELSKRQVASVFEELGNIMQRHFKKGAAGEFTMPGLMKCVAKRKPATKSRRGVNPFTGEMITFKAKPARNIIKVRALKRLKEMVK